MPTGDENMIPIIHIPLTGASAKAPPDSPW